MRTVGGLFDRICSIENLHSAFRRARRGKRDRPEVAAFSHDLLTNLNTLSDALSAGTWVPGVPRTFWISDPKRRLISAAPFADRVVHHAIVDVLEPFVERRLVADTYACRTGLGLHAALDRASHYAKRHPFVLQSDLARYFPSIDHEILKALFRRAFREAPLLSLLDRVVDGAHDQPSVLWWFPGDDLFTPAERRRGLPIGNLTSQLFANWYLDPFDHFVKETLRIPGYVRYMDDVLLFGDSKKALRETARACVRFMDGVRLRLHPEKTKTVVVAQGFNFLGFRLWPDRRRLTSKSKTRQYRRLRLLRRSYAVDELRSSEVGDSIRAMAAHARHGGGVRLWRGWLRRTIFRRTTSRPTILARPLDRRTASVG